MKNKFIDTTSNTGVFIPLDQPQMYKNLRAANMHSRFGSTQNDIKRMSFIEGSSSFTRHMNDSVNVNTPNGVVQRSQLAEITVNSQDPKQHISLHDTPA